MGARNIVPIDSHAMILSKGPLPEDWTEKLPKRLTESPLMVFAGGVSMFYACKSNLIDYNAMVQQATRRKLTF